MRPGDAGEMISYLNRAASATVALRAESLKLLRLSPGDMVLDAGCGSGVAAVELAALVGGEGRVHAIDPSHAMGLADLGACRGRRLSRRASVMFGRSMCRPVRAMPPAPNEFSST